MNDRAADGSRRFEISGRTERIVLGPDGTVSRQRLAGYPTEHAKKGEWVTVEVHKPAHPLDAYIALLNRSLNSSPWTGGTVAEFVSEEPVRLRARDEGTYDLEIDGKGERFFDRPSAAKRFLGEIRRGIQEEEARVGTGGLHDC